MEIDRKLLLAKLKDDQDYKEIVQAFCSWENEIKARAIEHAGEKFRMQLRDSRIKAKKRKEREMAEFRIDPSDVEHGVSFKTFCAYHFTLLDLLSDLQAGEQTIEDIIYYMEHAVELIAMRRRYVSSKEERNLMLKIKDNDRGTN